MTVSEAIQYTILKFEHIQTRIRQRDPGVSHSIMVADTCGLCQYAKEQARMCHKWEVICTNHCPVYQHFHKTCWDAESEVLILDTKATSHDWPEMEQLCGVILDKLRQWLEKVK